MDENKNPLTIAVENSDEYKRQRIKDKSDLPDWFKIENYDNANELTLTDWFNELAFRAEFYSMPLNNELDIPVLYYEDKNNPLKDVSRKRFFGTSFENDDSFYEVKQVMRNNKGYVKEFEGDLIFTGLVSQVKDYPRNNIGMIETQIPLVHDLKKDFVVNLLCPDAVILEHFKVWLKNERSIGCEEPYYGQLKNTKTIAKITEAKTQSWVRFGLLPFLDLHQWSLIQHFKIEQSVYVDSIFVEAPNQGESIVDMKAFQKTTQGLATSILSDLKTLGQQLIEKNEISKINRKKES